MLLYASNSYTFHVMFSIMEAMENNVHRQVAILQIIHLILVHKVGHQHHLKKKVIRISQKCNKYQYYILNGKLDYYKCSYLLIELIRNRSFKFEWSSLNLLRERLTFSVSPNFSKTKRTLNFSWFCPIGMLATFPKEKSYAHDLHGQS